MSLFKTQQQREQDQRVQDVLKRTDDVIAHTEKLLEQLENK